MLTVITFNELTIFLFFSGPRSHVSIINTQYQSRTRNKKKVFFDDSKSINFFRKNITGIQEEIQRVKTGFTILFYWYLCITKLYASINISVILDFTVFWEGNSRLTGFYYLFCNIFTSTYYF